MKPTTKYAFLVLIYLSFAAPCSVRSAPPPQAATPSNRPAQAQVMLAPAPMEAGQIPPQEPVPADARKPDRVLRVGHKGAVQALAFSPDGRWLASGGDDNNVILWNVSMGLEEFRFEGHKKADALNSFNKGAISFLVFNSEGTRLGSIDVSGVIRVWNLQTRKLLFAVNPHRVHFYGGFITYSTDGKSLIVAVEKKMKDATETAIGFYDAETGKLLRTIPTKWDFLSTVVPT